MSKDTMGTCPLGGLWYTCTAQSPTFMGCCTSNPCQGNGKTCPASDLRAAGMGTGSGPDLPSNDGSYWPNVQCSVGQWWTCATQTPSFQGCCEVNPCGGDGSKGGCPSASLHAAAFKSVTSDAGVVSTVTSVATTIQSVAPIVSNSVSVVTSVITSTPSTASSTTRFSQTVSSLPSSQTSTPVPAGSTVSEKSSSGPPIGAIAGGAGGGVAVLIIGLLIFCFCRKRRQKQASHYNDVQPARIHNSDNPSVFMGKTDEFHQKQAIADGYYANQPILGIQKPVKYTAVRTSSPPLSPGPPPYQSDQVSHNPNIHEMESPNLYNTGFQHHSNQPVSHSRNSSGVVDNGDGIAELPHLPAAENRWRSKRPETMRSVEIGEGSPRAGETLPVPGDGLGISQGDDRKKARQSYVSWQSLSP